MEHSLKRCVDLQNPCGLEDYRPGHHGELIGESTCNYLSECSDLSSRRFDRCMRKDAWLFAMSIADGTSTSSEKKELEDSYIGQYAKRILNNDTNEVIPLSEKTLDGVIANIMIKANNYLEKARSVKN